MMGNRINRKRQAVSPLARITLHWDRHRNVMVAVGCVIRGQAGGEGEGGGRGRIQA